MMQLTDIQMKEPQTLEEAAMQIAFLHSANMGMAVRLELLEHKMTLMDHALDLIAGMLETKLGDRAQGLGSVLTLLRSKGN